MNMYIATYIKEEEKVSEVVLAENFEGAYNQIAEIEGLISIIFLKEK